MQEYWNDGMLEYWGQKREDAFKTHYSIFPVFHPSPVVVLLGEKASSFAVNSHGIAVEVKGVPVPADEGRPFVSFQCAEEAVYAQDLRISAGYQIDGVLFRKTGACEPTGLEENLSCRRNRVVRHETEINPRIQEITDVPPVLVF